MSLDQMVRKDENLPAAYEAPKFAIVKEGHQNQKSTALQGIGRDITRLTWREAEAMGKGIAEKLKGKEISAAELTAAIQNYAWEYELFKEEERPRPAEK